MMGRPALTALIEVNIVPEIEPIIDITYDTCVAGPVSFVSSSSVDTLELTWEWNLGDGTQTSGNPISHIYNARDNYDIRLEVVDKFGCKDEAATVLEWFPFELTLPDTMRTFQEICPGDSILIDEVWIFEAGIYVDRLPSVFTGCDSIIEVITLDLLPMIETTILKRIICEGLSLIHI